MTRLSWAGPVDRRFETGLDRGVLYPKSASVISVTMLEVETGTKEFGLTRDMRQTFKLGSLVKASGANTDNLDMTGYVTAINGSTVTLNVVDTTGSGGYSAWRLEQLDTAVAWNGLTSVEEGGGESAAAYVIDGRPYLYLPKPKEYQASLSAYTYPDEFSAIVGNVEATDGMYLDSQQGDSFDLCYRTLVGNGVTGIGGGYKIHLIYNATATPGSVDYGSLSDNLDPIEFSWDIQAVPVPVLGYRPTAHITIDTRHMDVDKVAEIEALIYGTDTTPAALPPPQTIYDILSFGDGIVILDNGDGTWTAEGSYHNIYMIGDGIFQIDNVDAIDHGDGTYDISSTNV